MTIWLLSVNNGSYRARTAERQPISPKRIRILKLSLSLASFLISLLIAEGPLRLIEKGQRGDRAIENNLGSSEN